MLETRTFFFRETKAGTLVFDSRARTADDVSDFVRQPRPAISSETISALSSCELYDRLQYLNMGYYPRFKSVPKLYTLTYSDENTLKFNSSFESGNLGQAIKINENEYDLYLEYDTETQGYTNWFYFWVKTFRDNHTVRFNIMNMSKPSSLFTQGLQPLYFSSMTSNNWEKGGFNISYLPNNITRKFCGVGQSSTYFTLSFSFTIKYSEDRVYFAQSYPYTYNQLCKYTQELFKSTLYRNILKIETLCKTLAGNDCHLITITEDLSESDTVSKDAKKIVFLTSRVHPGETNSSYVIKGFIDYLITETREAKKLRKEFIFKIVPMLNPDGVIYGNYRCSLLGVDLNRRWKNPNIILHPTIFHTKQLIDSLNKSNGIYLFCDIHGHSSKRGSFIYGCRKKLGNPIDIKENLQIRLIPLILSNRYSNFDYSSCSFKIEKCKESTARVVVFKEFNVLMSYTLENSYLGLDCEYSQSTLQEIGYSICNVLWFCKSRNKVKKGVEEIYKASIQTDKIFQNVQDVLDGLTSDIIDKVYDYTDFELSQTDIEPFKKTNNAEKLVIRKKIAKSNYQVLRIKSKIASNGGQTFINRSHSSNQMKLKKNIQSLKDKRGTFSRIKVFIGSSGINNVK